MKRQRRFRYNSAQAAEVQRLDDRRLLSVTPLSPQTDHHAGTDQHSVTLRWEDTDFATASTYQVWCDQQVNGVTVISRAFANHKVLVAGRQSSVTIPYRLQTGEYKLWVRRVASTGNQTWSTPLTFELDNDDNPVTPLQRGTRPGRPDITVDRDGHGIFGQASSEPAFGWASESTLHNVQLYKQRDDGRWVRPADVRSVAGRLITQRQLAAVAANGKATYFADLTNQTLNAALPENRYRLWVQSINGAVDGSGNWIGVSSWTSPLDFQVNTITGSQAIPPNLQFTHGIRPTIQWDSVPASEHYMLSIQQGPDYANYPIVNVRIFGTQFQPSSHTINGSGGTVELMPGKEYFVRVRAVDQYGTATGFRFGNYAFGKLLIPQTLPATSVQPPVVNGPTGTTFDAFPVISWDHQTNAEAYEVWVNDLQLNQRILLATRITGNFLPLNVIQLQSRANTKIDNTARWSSETGLADGRYRFWVRSVNSTATGNTRWSRNFDFTIDSGSIQTIDTAVDTPVSRTPRFGAGHILALTGQATPSIVLGTGVGESFGQSVLARYILTDDAENPWQRPTFIDGQTGLDVLQFPDLAVGRNISGMKQMPNGWIAVTCRSSADLYIIDPVLWRVVSRFDFSSANEPAPQPTGLDVLANGPLGHGGRSGGRRSYTACYHGIPGRRSVRPPSKSNNSNRVNHHRY